MAFQLIDADTPIISLAESRRFITECIVAVGTPKVHAEAVANLLVEADYRGHYSHGMNRLEMYLSDIKNGVCDPEAEPQILKETPATAWVDGNNGLGVIVGTFCMDLAIKKAKTVGIGMVVCKGSNHYGIASLYSTQAMKKNLIGFTCTNTSPIVAPTRSKQPALGTNPLSCAAPALDQNNNFVLDMATSAVAMGKIQMKRKAKSEIPSQWLESETNALHPLGGNEDNSSHKGYGLGVLVEVLCGILGGGAYGPNIRVAGKDIRQADLGHCFLAIDPISFAPGFENRLSDFFGLLRHIEPIDPEKPVLVPGDPERFHMKAVDEAGGVRYLQDQLDTCEHLASSLNVENLKPNVPKM